MEPSKGWLLEASTETSKDELEFDLNPEVSCHYRANELQGWRLPISMYTHGRGCLWHHRPNMAILGKTTDLKWSCAYIRSMMSQATPPPCVHQSWGGESPGRSPLAQQWQPTPGICTEHKGKVVRFNIYSFISCSIYNLIIAPMFHEL